MEYNFYQLESRCTDFTARPEGSALFLKEGSQARASGVLQAMEGTEGTQEAAVSEGKCSAKMER